MSTYQGGPGVGVMDRSRVGTVSLAEKVMGLTFLLIGLAAVGERIGTVANNPLTGNGHFILWIIAEFACLLGAMFLADTAVVGFLLFCGFGFCTGVMLTPAIAYLDARGQGIIVFEALAATAGVCGGLTLYARSTTRDFSGLGSYLFAALIGLLVVSVVGIFVHSTLLQIVISGGATVLFSFFLVYDVQKVSTTQDTRGNAIRLALSIYLDILNVFVALLQLFSIMQSDED